MPEPHNTPAAAIAASRRAVGLPLQVQLRNGASARIRAVRPDDARRAKVCPPGMLEELVRVDGVRHVAFIATMARDDGEELIGEARYCVGADPECAELLITVADAWRGQGVADQLLEHLLHMARDAGLRWIFTEVPSTNHRALGFLRRMGFLGCAMGASGAVLRMGRAVATRRPRAARRRPMAGLRRWLRIKWAQLMPR